MIKSTDDSVGKNHTAVTFLVADGSSDDGGCDGNSGGNAESDAAHASVQKERLR